MNGFYNVNEVSKELKKWLRKFKNNHYMIASDIKYLKTIIRFLDDSMVMRLQLYTEQKSQIVRELKRLSGCCSSEAGAQLVLIGYKL